MRVLNQHLRLSRRRASLFFGMQKSMTTFPQREERDIPTPRAQAGATVSISQDEERGGIDGKGKTGKPSDQTANSTDSAGQGETG